MVFTKGNVPVIKKQLDQQKKIANTKEADLVNENNVIEKVANEDIVVKETKLTNEEKAIFEKDDILTKIKNIDTVWDYFKIFDIPINSTTLNIMYTHFGLTDTKKYGIQGCGPGINDLFNLLRNTSYKEVLQLFNK